MSKLSLAASASVVGLTASEPCKAHGLPFGNHPMEEEDDDGE